MPIKKVLFMTVVTAAAVMMIFACKPAKHSEPAKTMPDRAMVNAAQPVAADLGQTLRALPRGATVLVKDDLRGLLPESVIAAPLRDQMRPWTDPENRVNPLRADFILAEGDQYLNTIIYGTEFLWTILAKTPEAGGSIVLLRRGCPDVETCLEKNESPGPLLDPLAKMVAVEGGELRSAGPDGHETSIRFPPFEIGKYEVTQSLYARFLNEIGLSEEAVGRYFSVLDPSSKIVHYEERYRVLRGFSKIPAFNVSCLGAQAYCEHYRMRLPTASEWQWVAQGTDGRHFPWGDEEDFAKRADMAGDADGYPFWAPVGSFPMGASAAGELDMAGNLFEWTKGCALKGGSWDHTPEWARNFNVEYNDLLARNTHDGFRCVRDAR